MGRRGHKLEHDCIKPFIATGQVDELARNFHLDTDIILHIVQSVIDQRIGRCRT